MLYEWRLISYKIAGFSAEIAETSYVTTRPEQRPER